MFLRIKDVFCYVTAAVLLFWYVLFIMFAQDLQSWAPLLFLPFVGMALIVGLSPIRHRRRQRGKPRRKKRSKRERKTDLFMKCRPRVLEEKDRG